MLQVLGKHEMLVKGSQHLPLGKTVSAFHSKAQSTTC
jgi:hypothetical protein